MQMVLMKKNTSLNRDASQSHSKKPETDGKTWKSAEIWTKTTKNGLKINKNTYIWANKKPEFKQKPENWHPWLKIYHPIHHFRIILIWPGDKTRRPEHPTENEARRCSCDESV